MDKYWKLKPIPEVTIIEKLQNELAIPPYLATLLAQRGIRNFQEAEDFILPTRQQLHAPLLMKNMDKAVTRFCKAIENNEKIMVYGDYDVDGTTSVSLFLNVIRQHYAKLDYYIPDRFAEGYGLNVDAVNRFAKDGITLLFTLDCGIRSNKEIELAQQLGIEVIVCDHHEPGEAIPNGIILDPKQKDDSYPFKELCGCGVTFKFLQAVFEHQRWDLDVLYRNADIVSLAIAADIVPILDENRVLCFLGLLQINKHQDTVIDIMLKEAKKTFPVILSDIVFTIAPRINAAGRMQNAHQIVDLFTSTDLQDIKEKIIQINLLNEERKQTDREVTKEALSMVDKDGNSYSNVVYRENWFKGVLGIVASKLVEYNYRPSIVLTKSNGVLSGSGRSIPEINLFEVLSNCKDHLLQFGGHSFACGMSIEEANLPAFKKAFEAELQKEFKSKSCLPTIDIDLEIDFNHIVDTVDQRQDKLPKFVRSLEKLEPFGPGNMRPVFTTKNVYISDFKILKEDHVRFEFQQRGTPIRLNGIGFYLREKFDHLEVAQPVDLAYSIGVNYWNGLAKVQLEIKDIKPSKM